MERFKIDPGLAAFGCLMGLPAPLHHLASATRADRPSSARAGSNPACASRSGGLGTAQTAFVLLTTALTLASTFELLTAQHMSPCGPMWSSDFDLAELSVGEVAGPLGLRTWPAWIGLAAAAFSALSLIRSRAAARWRTGRTSPSTSAALLAAHVGALGWAIATLWSPSALWGQGMQAGLGMWGFALSQLALATWVAATAVFGLRTHR